MERGARLLGAVEGLLQSMGAVLDREDRLLQERGVQQARALLGEEGFEKSWEEGRAMPLEETIALALEPLPPLPTAHLPASGAERQQ